MNNQTDPTLSACDFDASDIRHDIDLILWSMRLHKIRRYFHQRFWEQETATAEFAERIEPPFRLESVSEHSWHVADTVLLLAPKFPYLDAHKCLRMAILHDKMEIVTGDLNPVGRDGKGSKTHAFNVQSRFRKSREEADAIRIYVRQLSGKARLEQEQDLWELNAGVSREACFVKAIDKLQALAFVLMKKRGDFQDRHLVFTAKYSGKVQTLFPPLSAHYEELCGRLFRQVSRKRGISVGQLVSSIRGYDQLEFQFPRKEEADAS